jgi:hypothetical protein
LIERYTGSARLAVGDADLLLAGLRDGAGARVAPPSLTDQVEPELSAGGPSADRFARTLAGAAVAIGDQVAIKVDQVESRNQVELGPAANQVDPLHAEQRLEHPEPPTHFSAEEPVEALFGRGAETLEPRDGPLTRRMDARDVRLGTNGRKSTFSGGLLGADDLPEFPLTRTPSFAKNVDEPKAVPRTNAGSAANEDDDSFEILVDEEILEIEPDDAIFEESSEDP